MAARFGMDAAALHGLLGWGDAWPLAPALVWGLSSRALGLVWLVAFVSIAPQVRPVAGARGIVPVGALFDAMRRDFSPLRRWLDAPSLLWLSSGDAMLQAIPWLGALAAMSIIVGGPHAPWAFLACYLLMLSLDRAMTLVYPWDSLLLESGFWSIFLPATAWGAWAAVGTPPPELTWVFRLLVFRVIFGFGKQKFLGSTPADGAFLQGFLIRQPLPTKLGWWMHHAPLPLLKLALALLFVIEVPLPFLIFLPGDGALVFAAACVLLMVAIALTGNFGFFNLLTVALMLPLLDDRTPWALSLEGMLDPQRGVAEHARTVAIALHTLGALIVLPINTWASFTWTLWPFWRRFPRLLTWPLAVFRRLQPLRWLHAYGVFPPRSGPAIRMAPRLEVEVDGAWEVWRPRIFPVDDRAIPRVVAPHHPRVDQAIIYESVGFTEASVLRNLTGRFDPYGHRRMSAAGAVMRGVLRGDIDHDFFFGDTPGRSGEVPPRAARMRLVMLRPTSVVEHGETGRWWHAESVGPHYSPLTLEDDAPDPSVPPPELWHHEDLYWQRRSRLGILMRQAAAGGDPHALVLQGLEGAGGEALERFWSELVPRLASAGVDAEQGPRDFHASAEAVRAAFDRAERRRLERIGGRYAAFLIEALEPIFLSGGLPALLGRRPHPLGVENHTQLAQLAHAIVLEGKDRYAQVLAEPSLAAELVDRTSDLSALLRRGSELRAVFRYENTLHQARLFRMLKTQTEVEGRPVKSERAQRLSAWGGAVARRLWGAFDEVDRLAALSTPAVPDMPERWPRFRMRPDWGFERIEDPDAGRAQGAGAGSGVASTEAPAP